MYDLSQHLGRYCIYGECSCGDKECYRVKTEDPLWHPSCTHILARVSSLTFLLVNVNATLGDSDREHHTYI